MSNERQSVAFLFAGQGNPVIGMGADLWDLNDSTKYIWDCASDISGLDIRRTCQKGPMPRLVQTINQQLAITAINVSLYSLCKNKLDDINIVGFCGHSVGEYSALYAAGALTLEDLFKVIFFRATLMDKLSKTNKGGMVAVKGIDYNSLLSLIDDSGCKINICCNNSDRQQVIGGTLDALRDFTQILISRGYETTKLAVSGAWHTHLMHDGVQLMREFLANIHIESPKHDVLMNVSGIPESNPILIKENLSLHLTHTVKWVKAIDYFLANKLVTKLIEISNKAYLGHLLKDFNQYSAEMSVHCRQI